MIDWKLVGDAIQFYQDKGYRYIEVPWIVNPQAVDATCPSDRVAIQAYHPTLELGFLVGSAEQSFIHMMIEDRLPPGRYCAATPCFRDDRLTPIHHRYFFKVELIEVSPSTKDITGIISCAREFMQQHVGVKLEVVKTEDGLDLHCNSVEVGSYGHRQYLQYHWIYGTGLALPRFTQANIA